MAQEAEPARAVTFKQKLQALRDAGKTRWQFISGLPADERMATQCLLWQYWSQDDFRIMGSMSVDGQETFNFQVWLGDDVVAAERDWEAEALIF